MILRKQKHAFTLAEVMIVLLVLTLLLAVFAPMITKRRTSRKEEDLWRWSTRNYLAGPMDAFYNPEDMENASLFIGLTPDSRMEINQIYTPLGKIIIRGGYIDDTKLQRQIQFRYGRANFDDIGNFAGSILADNANLLIGGEYKEMKPKISDTSYPANNIALGFEALNDIGDRGAGTDPALNNIAIGHRALETLTSGDDNIAIGAGNTSVNKTASRNTIIGYNAGLKTTMSNNTLIGYKSNTGQGRDNLFIGAKTGSQYNFANTSFSQNTAIGYEALSSLTTGGYNVAIGAGALKNLQKGYFNVAIGYNACANLVNEWYKTCIGYNSGPAEDSPAKAELGMGIDDHSERTYIGTNPNLGADGTSWSSSGYGGDAVLEIHNNGGNNSSLINNPARNSNTTTVINGNLVVMGNTYLTVGNILYPFNYEDNLFGANFYEPCSTNQTTYSFATTGNCSALSNLRNFSDRRLKDIGSKYSAGLNEINQIQVYNYTFKDDKNKEQHTGVIAQKLQKIFPDSVFKGEDGFLKIRWDEMFFASINAIKELNMKITTLMRKAVNLEAQIDKLEKENQELQAKANALTKRIEAIKSK